MQNKGITLSKIIYATPEHASHLLKILKSEKVFGAFRSTGSNVFIKVQLD